MLCLECRKELAKGHWWSTAKTSTTWKKGGRVRKETRKAGAMSPVLSGWRFPQKQDQGPYQLKGVVAGQ